MNDRFTEFFINTSILLSTENCLLLLTFLRNFALCYTVKEINFFLMCLSCRNRTINVIYYISPSTIKLVSLMFQGNLYYHPPYAAW